MNAPSAASDARRVTNQVVIERIDKLESSVCTRLERAETSIQNHEKRIAVLESDDSTRIMLQHLQQQIDEFRGEWQKWQQRLWYMLILLILIVAALAGIQQIPKLPFS